MKSDLIRSIAPFAAALAAATACLRASADGLQLLWWEVWPSQIKVYDEDGATELTKTETADGVSVNVKGKDIVLNGARVRAIDSSGNYSYLKLPDETESTSPDWISAIDVPISWYADITGYISGSPEYLFSIEIGNWDADSATWTGVALSEKTSYADLRNYITDWTSPGSTTPAGVTFWKPDVYTVPEPTSGLLLALGAALMALRRRRAEA